MTTPDERGTAADEVRRLYEELAPALLAYATSLLRSTAPAQDVLHQVFLRLLRGSVVVPREPRRYLFKAIRNAALNLLRSETRETARRIAAPIFVAPDGLEAATVELERALLELPEEQREIVILKVWGGLTFEEAANIAGVPPNTAASRYRYALAKLRERLEPFMHGGSR
ncbi:MAG: RNA polymerase sigma factor [Vicinamibacteria bacterium]